MNAYSNFHFVISFEYQNFQDLVSWNSFKVNWSYFVSLENSDLCDCIEYQLCIFKERMWHDQVWCPILGICALHLTHPSAHTQQGVVNTHTHHFGGFGALLNGLTSVVVLRVEESAVHSLPPPTIPAGTETQTRNLQEFQVWLSNH